MDEFQKEQNDLLKYILNIYTKKKFSRDVWDSYLVNKNGTNIKTLELFISPYCNQHCAYCYLVAQGNKLYPAEAAKTENVIQNLNNIYDYIFTSNLYLPRLDFFSGEIWGMPLGDKVLGITLKFLRKGMHVADIMIPSNCSFMLDDNVAKKINYYVEEYAKCGTNLLFSASIDGLPVEASSRPYQNANKITQDYKNEQYFDKLMDFFFKHEWGFHPMISAETIEHQKENYLWWRKQFSKFNKDDISSWYNYIMFLEVRNDNWTTDKILHYIDWLNFMMDYEIAEIWKDNAIEYLHKLILHSSHPIEYKNGNTYIEQFKEAVSMSNYYPQSIVESSMVSNEFNCSAGHSLCIRVGDLAIVPCHRTAYEKFVAGYIITDEDGKFIDVKAVNPVLLFSISGQGNRCLFKCDTCALGKSCPKGCLGAQYEATKDIFYPIDSVCDLYKARLIFMYHKINKLIDKYDLNQFKLHTNHINIMYNKLKEDEPEVMSKWEQQIIAII